MFKKVNFYIIFMFVSFFLCNCSEYNKTEFEKSIESEYLSLCNDSSVCTIDISKITLFKWDKMFIFKTSASLDIINKALGFSYPYYIDIAHRVIFLKNNKIVYHDDYYFSIENELNTTIIFDLPEGVSYKSYDNNNSIFIIKKTELDDIQSYFILSHNEQSY